MALKTQPVELLVLSLFKSKIVGSIHFNMLVGRSLDIAQPSKLFASKYIISLSIEYSCLGHKNLNTYFWFHFIPYKYKKLFLSYLF